MSRVFIALALLFCFAAGAEDWERVPLVTWPDEGLPSGLVPDGATLARSTTADGASAIEATFGPGPWPHVWFVPQDSGPWDWTRHAGMGMVVYNDSDDVVAAAIRVDNAGADGSHHCLTFRSTLPPRQPTRIEAFFPTAASDALWGMRGLPGQLPRFEGAPIDLAAITAFQLFLPSNAKVRRLLLSEIYAIPVSESLTGRLIPPFPFVDRFGQFRHAEWPGKLHSEEELLARAKAEQASGDHQSRLGELDRYGGWKGGVQLEATGWFRTAKHAGKWWMVTPEGHLFLSIGVNCVGSWEQTFVEQRAAWFEWLPQPEDPLFGALLTVASGAHMGAERIQGEGRVFSFYRANLARTFGNDWPGRWRSRTLRRLADWGFNTIGNWSQSDLLTEYRMPFVTSTPLRGATLIKAAKGHWSPMYDVFDDGFASAVDASIAALADKYRSNPLCIGYFIDNELAWEGVVEGVLASDVEQAARRQLIEHLKKKYGDLARLNETWQSSFDDWNLIRRPDETNAACKEDMDEFLYRFAVRYFATVKESLARHAPNQLYLGCRFASAPSSVVRACAEFADVVSFNQYVPAVECGEWLRTYPHDVPMMIGEFHFGALDRGMFHGGLVPVESQEARAAAYRRYWESLVDCSVFVGAHWFQYVDEPITGRMFDGENYNIGLVDVTDTPYVELTSTARSVHQTLYERRLRGPGE